MAASLQKSQINTQSINTALYIRKFPKLFSALSVLSSAQYRPYPRL